MAKQPFHGVSQYLRKLAAACANRELSDRELLERFVAAGDEAAFTVLIERHGPMVLGVCRRSLPTLHDAEDACQAAFLVLARKAASVRKKTSLGSWLHGVAFRAAAQLKRDHARRKAREREVESPAPTDPAAEVTWREVQALLDEELQRLPDRYRTPTILCYLECMTRDEAAKRLGLSPTTLHGRLERARVLLRERLAKRGLTLSAALSATLVCEGVASAALAPTFVMSSTKAALTLVAGRSVADGVVAAQVLVLTQEVLKTMFLTKLKLGIGAALCASLCAVLIGGSFTAPSVAQDAPRNDRAVASPKAENDLEFIRRISKDLRGIDPTPAEVHFFAASKDEVRRQKLVDLFIQERQAKKDARELSARIDSLVRRRWADERKRQGEGAASDPTSDADFMRRTWLDLTGQPPSAAELADFLKGNDPNKRTKLVDRLLYREDVARIWAEHFGVAAALRKPKVQLALLQRKFYTELYAAKDKEDVARITQAYLDRMIDHVTNDAKSQDIPDTMRQIVFVYESRGKTVEAGAWRDKLVREICGVEPTAPAAKDQKLADFAALVKKLSRLPAELTNDKKSDVEIVDALFRASLNRAPVDSERATLTRLLARAGAKERTQNVRDILWALVTSQESLKSHDVDGNVPESLRAINELSADWDKEANSKTPARR